MATLETDFGGITAGLFLSFVGLISIVISLFRLRSKDLSLFGDDRLEAFINRHSSDSADRIADKFIEHLRWWSGRSQERALDDDLTLIVIGVMAEPDETKLGPS